VDDHFKVGLVAKAALGGLDPGFGDIVGIEADGGGGNGLRLFKWDTALREKPSNTTPP
jgi:hypothetical protein